VSALLLALWGVSCVLEYPAIHSDVDNGVIRTYAVDSPRWQTCVALAANHLVAVVLGGKRLERRLNDATTETEDQVEGRLLLDVVVGEGAAVLELLAGEDQALLVRGNALLVLDLGLDIVYGLYDTVSDLLLLIAWRIGLRRWTRPPTCCCVSKCSFGGVCESIIALF
jgi:hypothetical protein